MLRCYYVYEVLEWFEQLIVPTTDLSELFYAKVEELGA